jgi:hypothetical protein
MGPQYFTEVKVYRKHRLQQCPLELFDAVRSWSVAALRFSIGIIIVGD